MVRRLMVSMLLGSVMAFAVASVGVAVAQPVPEFGKLGKGKKAKGGEGNEARELLKAEKDRLKAEKWALKLQTADTEQVERWAAEKAWKERAKAEKEQFKDREKVLRIQAKTGESPPRAATEELPAVRPTVLRYGNLPKELPAWWSEIDTDRDAQLSLFEWRTVGRKIEDFTTLDLNNDGFLTVEEYLRTKSTEEPKRR